MQKITLYLNQDNQIQTVPPISLSDLKNTPSLYDVCAIVPAQSVLLTYAKLPKLNRHRMLQALPFALEDQLLAELNDLHFAIGPYQTDGLPVAIVTKEKMAAWLAMLNELGIKPSAMTPESLAIPYTPNQWNIIVHDDIAIIRTELFSGFACDKNNLADMISLTLNESLPAPTQINIINYTENDLTVTTAVKTNERKVSSKHFLTDMHSAENPAINLLQQQYQARLSSAQNKKIWRLSAYLGIATISLLLIGNLVSFFILHKQVSGLDNSISKIYKHHFPLATTVTAPKERMTEKLNKLSNQNGNNRLLLWLAYVGKSLQQAPSVRLSQMDFHNNQLNLQLTASNSDNLDAFTQSLNSQGLDVRQQDVAVVGSNIKGTVIITENHES